MDASSITSIIIASIAAFVSIVSVAISYWATSKNEHDIEVLKADFVEKQSERDARRDYIYEARKRLYQEYEPLLFQMVEFAEEALVRIYGLARTARRDEISPYHSGWLSDPNGYYMTSTIYRLLAPLVIVKLIQRRLTLVDLGVDESINRQYILAKWLYISFREDFEVARIEPRLEYRPNDPNALNERKKDPEKYWRQGIFVGNLDMAIEALIVHEADGSQRCISYGEFEAAYSDPAMQAKFVICREIFLDFHPKTRPVLWRLLLIQVHIYQALLQARVKQPLNVGDSSFSYLLKPISMKDRLRLDWRQGKDEAQKRAEADDEKVLDQPFRAAFTYLQEHLGPGLNLVSEEH